MECYVPPHKALLNEIGYSPHQELYTARTIIVIINFNLIPITTITVIAAVVIIVIIIRQAQTRKT